MTTHPRSRVPGSPSSPSLPWWRGPVRMMRRDYIGDFRPFIESDLDALAREAKQRWQANCEWVMATLGCAPGLGHVTTFNSPKFEKLATLGTRDILREYIPHAHRHGIRVLGYINMHWYSYAFARKHPGWEQRMRDGTAYGRKHPLYGGGTTFCVNTPWRDWAFELIREVMRTGADGCFLDGPVFFRGACYCADCRRLFRAATGSKRSPKFEDWGDPWWKRFTEFRAESWARFMGDASAAAREVNPDAAMFLNGGGYSALNFKNAYDAARMESSQTFTGCEEFFHCTERYDSPFKTLNLSRFLSAGKNPGVVFTHHGLSTWHYTPLPPSEMATALAQTAAGGSNSWFAIFAPAIQSAKAEALAALDTTGRFLVECDAFTTGDRSVAETGVLLSNQTGYHYISRHRGLCRDIGSGSEQGLVADQGGPVRGADLSQLRQVSEQILEHEQHGCLDACNFGHIPVRVLWDQHLVTTFHAGAASTRRPLASSDTIKVLILPNAACLSDAQLAAIRSFVENGGGLVATFESGMYDERGTAVARKQWLRFLGIDRIEGVFHPSRTEDYLTLTSPLGGLPANGLIPRPPNALAIRPAHDAKVFARYLNPINKSYTQPRGISRYPALFSARRGLGRVVYIASPLFESFHRFHIDAHKQIARAAIEIASGKAGLQVETNAPASLAIEVRAQGSRTLLHLVNVTGDMKRPLGEIVPLRDIEIAIRATEVNRARCLRSGKRLAVTHREDRVCFRVPRVDDYEIVLLETA